MNVLAINGSPRKKWNTAMMLEKALEGAASKGAKTDIVHLYDLKFTGCTSCFVCKIKNGKSYGKCAVKDDLTSVLKKAEESDAVIIGSPIYFGSVTGETRSFLERFWFQYFEYSMPPKSIAPKTINTAFIYTMNASNEGMKRMGFDKQLEMNEIVAKIVFKSCESLFCFETLQFEDYSKVVFNLFDPAIRIKRREEVFPQDLKKAYNLGVRLVSK
jgi:putative NADPH-quinone reductase